MRRVLVLLAVLLAIGSVAAPAAAAATPPGYYLSLGDSLAFGYQPDLVAAGDLNAADYRSYAEDYALLVQRLRLVNYGCPGETTTTMIDGGCPWPGSLHDSYGTAGSQYQAAVTFLEKHRGRVRLISVDIGSNDLLGLVDSCNNAADLMQCVEGGLSTTLATMAANYGRLVATLRELAPGAKIVLFNFYNPLALSIPGSDVLAQTASTVVDDVAGTFGASVADAFGAINGAAGSPIERPMLCTLTWECTSYQNVHPTTLGYWALTVALWRAVNG